MKVSSVWKNSWVIHPSNLLKTKKLHRKFPPSLLRKLHVLEDESLADRGTLSEEESSTDLIPVESSEDNVNEEAQILAREGGCAYPSTKHFGEEHDSANVQEGLGLSEQKTSREDEILTEYSTSIEKESFADMSSVENAENSTQVDFVLPISTHEPPAITDPVDICEANYSSVLIDTVHPSVPNETIFKSYSEPLNLLHGERNSLILRAAVPIHSVHKSILLRISFIHLMDYLFAPVRPPEPYCQPQIASQLLVPHAACQNVTKTLGGG